jgi:hypothetical protein
MAIARGVWRLGSVGFIAAVVLCGLLTSRAGADDDSRELWFYNKVFGRPEPAAKSK